MRRQAFFQAERRLGERSPLSVSDKRTPSAAEPAIICSMKILFSGGGTGGHFYPIIAISQAIHELVDERKIIPPELYFMSNSAYNPQALFENEVKYMFVPAGKRRRYFSILNAVDMFKMAYGCLIAVIRVYSLYPDVVFGKGGYASFPALFAAKMLNIPVVIHESDSHPGKVNLWAARFARRIAIAYPSAAQYFKRGDQEKIAYTGNPVRSELANPMSHGAHEFLKLEEGTPVLFVLGGSQGSANINDALIEALPDLLNRYQIIHQTGKANLAEIISTTSIELKDHPYRYRYHPFDYLNVLAMRMAAGVADIVVSRAGAGAISEIAAWGVPSIIIPLSPQISHDQLSNALAYAASGAASVIKDDNLRGHILTAEIDRIYGASEIKATMRERARAFARPDSAKVIAGAILDIALEHEK